MISLQNSTYLISVIIADREGMQRCITVTPVKFDIVKTFFHFIASANCFTIQFQKELDSSIANRTIFSVFDNSLVCLPCFSTRGIKFLTLITFKSTISLNFMMFQPSVSDYMYL